MRQLFVCAVLLGVLQHNAAADTVGAAIAQQGGSVMLINAGDAIQGTCRSLAGPGGSNVANLQGRQQDLYFRCNEMVTTYVGGNPSNSYGYAPGAAGDQNRANAVRQFSGEETSGQRRLGADGNNVQANAIGARMDAIRRGIRPSGSGVAMNVNGVRTNDLPLTSDSTPTGGAAGDSSEADLGWAWFVNANLGSQDRDRSPNEDGYDADYYGGTLGADYAMRNGAVVGVAFGYENYTTDIDGGGAPTQVNPTSVSAGGGVDGDSYVVSVYGTYSRDEWYSSLIVSYGTADYDLNRRALFLPGVAPVGRPSATDFIINRSYHANTDSHQFAAEATLGAILISSGPFSMDGYAKVDYLSLYIDGYTEKERDNTGTTTTPGLALTYLGQDVDTTETSLGVTLRYDIGTSFGVLTPYLGEEGRYRWNGGGGRLHYSYANAIQHVDFASPLDNNDKVYSVVTAGLSGQLAHNVSVFAQYEAFVGLSNVTGGVGTIGVRGMF